MRFVWFWTFWHWSKESFRAGSLLRTPLHGIGSHWDEWFRHEASQDNLRDIEEAGRTEATQRQFIAWLFRHWVRETEWRADRMIPRFVLGQLAHLPPFNRWQAFERYRQGYGIGGIAAIVLGAESSGQAEDVRTVEGLALPGDGEPKIESQGFHADASELEAPRRAAMSLLSGKGLLVFLGLWFFGGRRPYPRGLRIALGLGWLAVAALILYLLLGPEPGPLILPMSATLISVWIGLVLTAVTVAARQSFRAWRRGQNWEARLKLGQVRLRMNGGLTLKGESAGLPFCLNTLLSLYRANPRSAQDSWLWQQVFRKMNSDAGSWAATGVITSEGYLKPVVLESKLQACLRRSDIQNILTPKQAGASQRTIERLIGALISTTREKAPFSGLVTTTRLGFAAEKPRLRSHPCRHVAHSIMALGGLTSASQKAVSALAIVVSGAVLVALPDLRCILLPPPVPAAVAPSSSSPYHLWVSLDTKYPDRFQVVLESDFWSNRRAEVAWHNGAPASMRAEIFLHRLPGRITRDEEDGTVWIERRRRFLGREYAPGERVGRYSLAYLTRLDHE